MASGNGNSAGSSPIRAVILDFGEVLCLRPDPEIMARMARILGIEPESFLERYVESRGPYDQGLLTPEEYWNRFAEGAGISADAGLIEKLRAMDLAMWSRMNAEMIDWLKTLHEAGLTTALLSNMQHDMAAHARKNFAWLQNFDHQLLSCELRLIKPDVEIFERTIERIGARPEQALFVDDRKANVEAAKATGLRAIQFVSVGELRSDLREIGFGILPGHAERISAENTRVATPKSGRHG
jgi:putative hydrolase of the HAD superfamily